MSDRPIVDGSDCPHAQPVIAFERDGSFLHQTSWMVMRCVDCGQLLDRKRLSRGEADRQDRGKR
jgi:hypothetical protein